ncbi:2-phospho-L-lactate guanylyltransferase [Limibacillus halophilus]|uniref:3-phospho-D-glycerate guanylyltransferase n=1 Tax=Limibacillus halophilus TaxID=1579333 RepID=A0A839SSD6_9PROT|nr:2-phospho-L-lactate guanylyltransferase [Limibacillus halophilus]MBB3064256.1 2-phospho-L-lactate guanylyltransferase [Limibacillus halophilus]
MIGRRFRWVEGQQGLHVVVPVKSLAQSKSRLAPLLAAQDRQKLTLAMCSDILQLLRGSQTIQSISVVTRDAQVAALARAVDATVLVQQADCGLTAAVEAAAAHLARQGADNLLYLPCDVPLLGYQDLEALAHCAGRPSSIAIVPSHDGEGTNGLLCRPPQGFPFAFEGNSFHRHRAAAREANLCMQVLRLDGPALDIDKPDDVERFLKRSAGDPSVGLRTRRLLLDELQLRQEMAGPGGDFARQGFGMGL